jgi:thiol-disulfide isomerase/thioredoxin
MLLTSGCGEDTSALQPVVWTFHLNDSVTFSLNGSYSPQLLTIENGPELLTATAMNEGRYHLPPFDGIIEGTWSEAGFQGVWRDQLRVDYAVQLTAARATHHPPAQAMPTETRTWNLHLPASDPLPSGTLILTGDGTRAHGTVATPTGDFRFLTGQQSPTGYAIGTFDGAHLYLFQGEWNGQDLVGNFYSGNHYETSFKATERIAAPQWTPGTAQMRDSIPFEVYTLDSTGKRVHMGLKELQHDVTVIDLMGTWCPNCIDEIQLLKSLAVTYPDVGFMSVAFERNADTAPEQAFERLDRFRQELEIPWEIRLGGIADKQVAAEAFPFLERVASFPTTLFIHRDGRILTHSGFNGPATGDGYAAEVAAFHDHSQQLLGQRSAGKSF